MHICCGAVVNYDALRAEAKQSFASQIVAARAYVSKLQKAQRAGERALDMSLLWTASTFFAPAAQNFRSKVSEKMFCVALGVAPFVSLTAIVWLQVADDFESASGECCAASLLFTFAIAWHGKVVSRVSGFVVIDMCGRAMSDVEQGASRMLVD